MRPILPITLCLCVCLLSLLSSPVSGSCVAGDGYAVCTDAGVCTNTSSHIETSYRTILVPCTEADRNASLCDQDSTRVETIVNIIPGFEACLCDPGRYESDGDPSWSRANALCTYSLTGASPALYRSGSWALGIMLVATLLATLLCCGRVTLRRSGRETRFQRLLVSGSDVLKPTPVQLRFARIAFTITAVAMLLWTIEHAADPFGNTGALNKAGGYSVSLDDSGRATGSGIKIRYVLDDLGEWLLLIVYSLFFYLFRKVCVPAPALLSGDRFQKRWFATFESDNSAGKKGTVLEHNIYLQTQLELDKEIAEAEKRREAREERERLGIEATAEDHADRDREWLAEEQRALRTLHDELALADVAEMHKADARRAALSRKMGRLDFDTRLNQSSGLFKPPPPPPQPPAIPTPDDHTQHTPQTLTQTPSQYASPSKASLKYAVTSGGDDSAVADSRDSQFPTGGPPRPPLIKSSKVAPTAIPIVAPDRGNKVAPAESHAPASNAAATAAANAAAPVGGRSDHFTKASRNLLAGIDPDEIATSERKFRNQGHKIRIADTNAGALASDDTTIALDDLAAFPVPDSLKLMVLLHVGSVGFTFLLWLVGDLSTSNRVLFSGGLFVIYMLQHACHLYWLFAYYDPLYLISLKEDLLVESGIKLPRHRLIHSSTGSETSASTSTIHFGMKTAYELSKGHELYQFFIIVNITFTIMQNVCMLYVSVADPDEMTATRAICFWMLNKLLQSLRVICILFLYYPFQPIIQYLTLHSFWLDQKLEWISSSASDISQVQSVALPQLQHHGSETDLATPTNDPFPSTRIEGGCLACVPLLITTSFRPIPTRDELQAQRQAAMLPKLVADLKRMRRIDRESGGGTGISHWARLLKSGARHQHEFVTVPNPALTLDALKNEEYEKLIAHQQFVLWRRHHLHARGLDEDGQPVTRKAKREHELAEKVMADAKARMQAKQDADAAALAAARASLQTDDPFKNLQEYYGDPDGTLVLAALRARAKELRKDAKLSAKEHAIEEFRKLKAIAASPSRPLTHLPPIADRPNITPTGPTTKVKVILQKDRPAVIVRPTSRPASPLHSSTSVGGGVDSGSQPPLAPLLLPGAIGAGVTSAELHGVLDEPDDFISVSRSNMAHDAMASPRLELQTPRF